jgi:ribose transport system ATP-binding protein
MLVSNNGTKIKVENITKRFGGTLALDNVNFEIKKGEVHAIVGENGAGKSTMMKILAGVYKPDSGKLYINGNEAIINSPMQARMQGISIVFQELNLFPALSVADNIFMNNELKAPMGFLKKFRMFKASNDYLKLLIQDLHIDPGIAVNDLSVADQQIVEITRALSQGSEILILDEPNSALSETESQNLFKMIKKLKNDGITIIYVSHRLEEVFSIADRITVFRDGNYINTWNISEIEMSQVISEMIGKEINEMFPAKNKYSSEEIIFECKNISKKNKIKSIDFSVKKGEVLGFAGLEGCGIEDIFRIIFGIDKKDSGEFIYEGKSIKKINPWLALKHGWGFVPAERHRQGLMLNWSIKANLTLGILNRILNKFKLISPQKTSNISEKYVNKLNIVTRSIDKKVDELSGGNQQKVVIAKWLATNPKLLILNDPTRGIDVGAKFEIYKLINELSKEGYAIIFTSSEINEIIELCDRILVVFNKKFVKSFEGHKMATKADIMEYVTGGFQKENKKVSA